MGVLQWLRRPAAIADAHQLDAFFDSRAAFLVQKCIYEYARARSGVLWQKLFREPAFRSAVEQARWGNYPRTLGFVAEMALTELRRQCEVQPSRLAAALGARAEAVMSAYPVPDGFPPDFWLRARAELENRLQQAADAPTRPVGDIPLGQMQAFLKLVPIHADLRQHDGQMIANHLRMNLCRVHGEFVARCRPGPLVDALLSAEEPPARPVGSPAG